jgi:predicted dehydrogenase
MTASSSPPLGLAIVGCGQIVTHHLAAIASLMKGVEASETSDSNCNASMELRALCDPSAERRQTIVELPASQSLLSTTQPPAQYTTLDELIADSVVLEQIQIIFIAVPHDLHETLALQALSALSDGKMVVMEKPLAPTRDSCDKLVETSLQLSQSKSCSLMLVIAEQSPYWQEIQLAKKLISANAIGTIVTAASYYYESMRTNETSGNVDDSGGLGWRGSLARAGGGKRAWLLLFKTSE